MRKIYLVSLIVLLAIALVGCAERTATTTSSQSGTNAPIYTSSSAAPGEIPAGTTLVIRTNEEIQANSASSRSYTGEVVQEIRGSDGRTLVPRNSPVNLSVFEKSDKELELGLQSLRINGQNYYVRTGTVTQTGNEGIGMNRRTAKMVGGGALLGTLIGAVAGGAKGAAVGAAVGAGAGAGVQVLTKGKEVKIPAETELTFRLDEPLMLETSR